MKVRFTLLALVIVASMILSACATPPPAAPQVVEKVVTQVVEKVEELTLYTIEQGKLLRELRAEIESLKEENASLRKSIKRQK